MDLQRREAVPEAISTKLPWLHFLDCEPESETWCKKVAQADGSKGPHGNKVRDPKIADGVR